MDDPGQLGRTAALIDVGIALGLLALGQVEVWAGDPERTGVALAVVSTLPLAVRRLVPVTVLVVALACLAALTLGREDSFTVAQLLGLMLATYTVAGARPVGPALGWLGLVIAAALANSAAAPDTTAGDFVFPLVLLGVPWAAGAAMRQWQARAEQLRVLSEELRAEREMHARLVVAAERGRIARELHDSVAQTLNAVVVHAGAAEEALDRDPQRVAASLARIQEVGRASLSETRQLLTALRSEGEHDGFEPRLDQLDQMIDVFRRDGLDISVEHDEHLEDVPGAVEAAVYRIVQESLTNVVRHANARHVQVSIHAGDPVEVEVRDDGPGRTRNRVGTGLGVLGMRERAHLLGGTLTAGPAGPGWTVRALIPIEVGG